MAKTGLPELELKSVYRLVDRAAYAVTGGRVKLGSDVWATPEELERAEQRFDPLEAPLCTAAQPLTITQIVMLLEDEQPLPDKHRGHPACKQMFDRLKKTVPPRGMNEAWLKRLQERTAREASDAGAEPASNAEPASDARTAAEG